MPRNSTRRPVRRGPQRDLTADLTAAVNDWIHERRRREASVRTRHIRRLSASSPGHVRALRIEAQLFIGDPAELRRVRAALAVVAQAISRGARRWRRENPAHRPDEQAFYAAVRAAAKRHHATLPAAVDIILTRIAPALPEEADRAALVGPWHGFKRPTRASDRPPSPAAPTGAEAPE
jgi:hypothetical protein